jgi:DHA1 family multidrug resistance protein-like MFS transporter
MTAAPRGSGATSRILARLRPNRDRLPRDIKVMLVAAFLIALGFGLVAPVLPQFATTFGVGNTEASVIVAIFALMRLVFAPAGGSLIGKVGERPVYVAGLLIVAVSTAACAFAQDYWQLLLFRGLGGAGSVMFTVASMALVIRLAPPESRGRVSGAYASAFLVGNVCGPIVGGLLAGFGLRIPFLAYAAALVVAALVVQTQLSHQRRGSANEQQRAPDMNFGEALATGRTGLRCIQLRQRVGHVRRADGHCSAVGRCCLRRRAGGGGAGVGRLRRGQRRGADLFGRLADSMGRRPMMIAGLLVAGAATAAIGFADQLGGSWPPPQLAGVGSGLFGPAQQAAVADVIGSGRSGGKVLAVYQMASDVGAIVGPVAAGVLADRLGYGWAFGVTGGIMLLAAGAWLGTRETLRPAKA